MKKVFCIGLPKTGTTSFGKAFELLGYRHHVETDCIKGCNSITHGNYRYSIDEIENNDVFEETPYHLIYEWLDAIYEAQFMLTTRISPETYLNSLRNEPDPSLGLDICNFANPRLMFTQTDTKGQGLCLQICKLFALTGGLYARDRPIDSAGAACC